MARKYHNLSGLVRDLEHAIEVGGTEEWDLLSRFDNALFAIEEADVESTDASPDAGVDDLPGDDTPDGDEPARLDAGSLDMEVGRRSNGDHVPPKLRAGVASRSGRATSSSAAVGVPTPVSGARALSDEELAQELKRRGVTPSGKVRLGCGTREA